MQRGKALVCSSFQLLQHRERLFGVIVLRNIFRFYNETLTCLKRPELTGTHNKILSGTSAFSSVQVPWYSPALWSRDLPTCPSHFPSPSHIHHIQCGDKACYRSREKVVRISCDLSCSGSDVTWSDVTWSDVTWSDVTWSDRRSYPGRWCGRSVVWSRAHSRSSSCQECLCTQRNIELDLLHTRRYLRWCYRVKIVMNIRLAWYSLI